MPVISVSRALDLLQRGQLDGRAVAVAGYYYQVVPSCPYPGRYVGPLEGWCTIVAFTDDVRTATFCRFREHSVSCRLPSAPNLKPQFTTETGGSPPSLENRTPVPLVLIGHAGDARHWQCAAPMEATCRNAFVVDRIAWADGHNVPLTVRDPWDETGSKELKPHLTLSEAEAALPAGTDVLTATPVRVGDVSLIDPRWQLAGDEVVWLLRSIAGEEGRQETRSVTVSLVDDASATLLSSHDLALDETYRPARLWIVATTNGTECCAGDVYAFYRVQSVGGNLLHEGIISGSTTGHDSVTTYYADVPTIVDSGTYSVSVWLATRRAGAIGPAMDGCSTQIALSELDDVQLQATFAHMGQVCVFEEPAEPNLSR